MSVFSSAREAIAYSANHHKGPRMARQRHASKAGDRRDEWDAANIRSCMTRAGAPPGSAEAEALDLWANKKGEKPTRLVKAFEREALAAGLLVVRETLPRFVRRSVMLQQQDPDTGEIVTVEQMRSSEA